MTYISTLWISSQGEEQDLFLQTFAFWGFNEHARFGKQGHACTGYPAAAFWLY
jgi:hypothetical protein